MIAPNVVIETVYRCRIDYDIPIADDVGEFRCDRVGKFADMHGRLCGVEVEDNHAGPCWNAYLIFEGASAENVRRVAQRTANYVLRFKGGQIL